MVEPLLQPGALALAAVIFTLAAATFILLRLICRPLLGRQDVLERGSAEHFDIVDSFPLGRRRQLLVIRRGETENLVMIGGPNDLAIETGLAGPGPAPPLADDDEGAVQAPIAARFDWEGACLNQARRIFASEGLVPLALLSGAAGAAAGMICGFFRVALETAGRFRVSLPVWWQDEPFLGASLLIAGAAAATALSAWLVRRFSMHAAGSGIPQVEAAISGGFPPAPVALLPVKFIGGLLAMGAGLALGREGPCVQMGATAAYHLGKAFRRSTGDCRTLLAAGAGAGLAAAFNAPLAGSAFVLEELLRKFETRNAIAALGASGSAIAAAQLITGPAPDFTMAAISYPTLSDNLLCFTLGIIAGLCGALYNRMLFGALAISDRFARWPVEARAAVIGAAAGLLAWFAPGLAGGGDMLTQRTLDGTEVLAFLSFVLLLRLVFSAASYAAGTPGGLFAPLLALGAQMGFLFGGLVDAAQAGPASHAAAFAAVGMAALFTAVVRAPLTGMILVTEMTANSMLLLPMLAACFSAMAVAALLDEPPVYDALRKRTIALWQKDRAHP
ncbi:MAG: ClC family H(+)/Cl(-) exchange transporter [Beijerinckiaceae bacterium]|nr:ClC family H(+)/Cl(-) exchange transporter [Beijerinckiaceae bacterium]